MERSSHHHRHSHRRSSSKSRSRSRSHERRSRPKRPSRFDDPNIPSEPSSFQYQPRGEDDKPEFGGRKRRSRWGENIEVPASQTSATLASLSSQDMSGADIASAVAALKGSGGAGDPKLVSQLGMPLISFTDSNKLKRKIYLPRDTGVNYIGLLIGPKGLYQKRLEEQTQCKILIRGKGSQKEGQPPLPDDEDEQHVLIVGDNEATVERAVKAINAVINSDEETRNRIRQEQLEAARDLNNTLYGPVVDESLLTPYGPPSPYAYIIPVPNECVGLIIGKGGETIRKLQQESGAKVQVAKKEIAETGIRNVFVEGPPDKYEVAKRLIEAIVEERNSTMLPGMVQEEFPIPNNLTGLIIGRGGETLKKLIQKTRCNIYIPKEPEPGSNERILQLRGAQEAIADAKREIALMTSSRTSSGNITDALKNELIAVQRTNALSMLMNPEAYASSYAQSVYLNQWSGYEMPPEYQQFVKEQQDKQGESGPVPNLNNSFYYQQFEQPYSIPQGTGSINPQGSTQASSQDYQQQDYYNYYYTGAETAGYGTEQYQQSSEQMGGHSSGHRERHHHDQDRRK